MCDVGLIIRSDVARDSGNRYSADVEFQDNETAENVDLNSYAGV